MLLYCLQTDRQTDRQTDIMPGNEVELKKDSFPRYNNSVVLESLKWQC